MNYTDEQVTALMDRHDGANGWAEKMCPSCHVIHPCPTWLLAQDVLTARRGLEFFVNESPTSISGA